MKKNLIIIVVALLVSLISFSQNISGTYKTDFGDMTLTNNGNRITGTYKHKGGKVEGILTNKTLVGTWTQTNGKGKIEFIFNSDFSSFTGKWGNNNNVPRSKWNGTKTQSISSTNVVYTPTASITNIAGEYNTDFGNMTLTNNGNRVTGTYKHKVSWIDEERNLWKSYKGEGQFEGRKMNFKVFPAVENGLTIDQGYEYHWTISSDNNLITAYYTRHGKRTVETNFYYKRVK
jgi:hypothetical protein